MSKKHVWRGFLTINSPESMCCLIKPTTGILLLWIYFLTFHFSSPPRLRSRFSSSRQLCQTAEELLTLTGSDEAVQADVFLFALGETASLTLSWLILGLGLSQRQCLYLPLHTHCHYRRDMLVITGAFCSQDVTGGHMHTSVYTHVWDAAVYVLSTCTDFLKSFLGPSLWSSKLPFLHPLKDTAGSNYLWAASF